MRLALALATALIAAAAMPAVATAHSLVRVGGGQVNYLAIDATSLNALAVSEAGGEVRLRDPAVDGGMDPGPCRPGQVSDDANAWIVETFCPRPSAARLRLDLGEREDSVTISASIPATVLGGPGADALRAGPASDVVDGGEGRDRIAGGAGDDRLLTRDGLADAIGCGAGTDRVEADSADVIADDCENVDRRPVPPPAGGDGAGDTTPPLVEAGGSTLQRLDRRGRFRVLATSSEAGHVAASGFLDVAGLSLPLQGDRRRVAVDGGGAVITVRLRGRALREARRALRRGRRVTARIGVVATDSAGNSAHVRAPRIRLRAAARRAAATAHPEPGDIDGDGIGDEVDNCPQNRNSDQANADGDPQGDTCDADADNDGHPNEQDNCLLIANADQADDGRQGTAGNGVGDACDKDSDGDGLPDEAPRGRPKDNCAFVFNPDQADNDFDRVGDACDPDDDEDGILDASDNCPRIYEITQADVDGDGAGDACDPRDDRSSGPSPAGGTALPGSSADRERPVVRLTVGRRQAFAELGGGLAVGVRCSEACAATATLRLGRSQARGLGPAGTPVARGVAQLGASGSTYVFLKFDRKARRKLWRLRRVDVQLQVAVSDRGGNRASARRMLTLHR